MTSAPALPHASRAARAWQRTERALDAVAGAGRNPLRHLGSLGFLFFWWLAASGIYLYAMFDTSATAAHESVARLARLPWYAGGWLRSLHRYAADAFVVVMGLHLLREASLGRFRGFRRHSWLTGVPLVVFAFGGAIVGFWLAWDRLAQFSAVATAEWLDALPFFATPLSRNFQSVASVTDRLFSLFVFLHLGVPLLMLFGLWFHVQRVAHAAVFPPRPFALGGTGALVALAAFAPVASQAPADLRLVPAPLAYDWFLLSVHPLVDVTSPVLVWALLAVFLSALLALPFLPAAAPRVPVAVVDPGNCNGCRRCLVDCPYAAITMVPHPDWQTPGRPIRQLAQVDADLCASCGVCVGACPSSTPFRSGERLVTGIDMPQQPIDSVRRRLDDGLAALTGAHRLVVVACTQGPDLHALEADDVLVLRLACAGQLPPSFVDYALRQGASGVVVTGCREGDCAWRLGQRFTEERLRGQREPHLRADLPRERLRVAWPSAREPHAAQDALAALRASHAAARLAQEMRPHD